MLNGMFPSRLDLCQVSIWFSAHRERLERGKKIGR